MTQDLTVVAPFHFLNFKFQGGSVTHVVSLFLWERKVATMVEIQEVAEKKKESSSSTSNNVEKYNELMEKMDKARKQWAEEDGDEDPDDPDQLLTHAINMAIEQGRGWAPGEKEAYLEKILDDDFIPPLFASTPEEVEKSGLQEAFTSLIYDDESPTSLMLQFRKKGNEAFANGKRNEVKNMQFYRDAINHWYEAFAWAQKIQPLQAGGDLAQADTDDPTYTEPELDDLKSTICGNIALAHMQLSNWGHTRDECKKALVFNDKNVKAWYRLAKAHQMLKDWEEAGNAIDSGLAVPGEEQNKDLLKLQKQLADKIQKARRLRQQRERARAERVAKVKAVWKHSRESNILLGRVPLVASVTDEVDDDEEEQQQESRWHNHLPHSGMLPVVDSNNGEWSWPCMFLYPSHNQSDFVKNFGESEMIALRMAEVLPEIEHGHETTMPWDYNNEFTCSQLAVYFEVHEAAVEASQKKNDGKNNKILCHPESVELLKDQASCMRFYESSRALKGDEGADIANVVRLVEQKHLGKQRRAWKKQHGSLWAKPDPSPVVRVHPAMTLRDVLTHPQMVVPSVS